MSLPGRYAESWKALPASAVKDRQRETYGVPTARPPPRHHFRVFRGGAHRQVLENLCRRRSAKSISLAASGGGRYNEGCTIRLAPLFHAALKIWTDGVEDARWAEGGTLGKNRPVSNPLTSQPTPRGAAVRGVYHRRINPTLAAEGPGGLRRARRLLLPRGGSIRLITASRGVAVYLVAGPSLTRLLAARGKA